MLHHPRLLVAGLVVISLGLAPAALAGPGGRGGGGRPGGGRGAMAKPSAPMRGGPGALTKPQGVTKPGTLAGPRSSGTGAGSPGSRLQDRGSALGGAGPLAGGAILGSGSPLSGSGPRAGSNPLGGASSTPSEGLSGRSRDSLADRGGKDATGGSAASGESPLASGSAESRSASRSGAESATAEDGVEGPRGGSVDVDQTTTSDSVTTTVTAESASGESASHTGTWTQQDGYVTYDGSGSTSTGRQSETHAAGAMTDAGLVVGGTTTNNQGSAAGVALVNENGIKAAGIGTNGETVTAGAMSASNGTVTGATISGEPGSGNGATVTTTTASPASGVTSTSYYVYPYPVYGARIYPSAYGAPIYWWATTPVVAATVALAASEIASDMAPATVEAYYSPVVTYATPKVAVYATTYAPRGLYAEPHGDRYYWVPGAASPSSVVESAIQTAARMTGPTSGGTVIAYDLDGGAVFLTNEPPIAGTYEKRIGGLFAWMPGVMAPSEAERRAIDTALTAHAQGGSEALAAASANSGQGG